MHVIGTAGHVDHGKSSLVAALTGIHPDRLKEEREREMTIDLGFAWLELPGGESVGIVDVPGHRDFIENMLAGVGGIDAALFVVAADEGIMPQTREHLAILDILRVEQGVIALTKIDLIDDPDWLLLVEKDIRDVKRGTVLEDAPIVRVSARTNSGLDELRAALASVLRHTPTRADLGRPRLPVDRVFSMAGFGTVVTGTLLDGHFQIGDEVEILPATLRGRIRGLQTHKRKENIASPGSRTAINISGLNASEIKRGDVVVSPGVYQATRVLDVSFRLSVDASGPLKHSSEAKLFIGAAEVIARVRVLGADHLDPGMDGWLQLELRAPVVAVRGDRYILRRPSPAETLGGGSVLDPQPSRRHRRFDEKVLERLRALERGSDSEVLVQAARSMGITPIHALVARARLDSAAARAALHEMVSAGELISLEPSDLSPGSDRLIVDRQYWQRLTAQAAAEVDAFHHANPLKRGMPREVLKSRMKMQQREYLASLKLWMQTGDLQEEDGFIKRPGFRVQYSPQQQARVNALLDRFAANPFTPPSVKEVLAEVPPDLYASLLESGSLVQVSSDVVFRKEEVSQMRAAVIDAIQQQGSLTLAQFRDRFNTTRKYAQAFLEYLDSINITIREGEYRRLRH